FFVVDWGWEVTGSVRCLTGSTGFHGSLSVHRRAGHTDRFRPRTTQRSPWVRVWTRKATSRPDTVETRVPLLRPSTPCVPGNFHNCGQTAGILCYVTVR